MKIWHIGASSSPQKVCGVNNSVWLLAREQALQNHQVSLILHNPPAPEAITLANEVGIELIYIPANIWRYDPQKLEEILSTNPSQLVHIHSVFVPRLATVGRSLVRHKIPYIASPRGGLDFRRGWLKKMIYSALIEKPRLYNAAAITALTPTEERIIQSFLPGYQKPIRWLPNPIDMTQLSGCQWQYNQQTRKVVYLGRFDVLHKGLDLIVEIARFLPDVEFDLYGSCESKTERELEKLKENLPSNVQFKTPIFNEEKAQVLTNASLYIQMSRWEGFGRSIAEAMSVGLPCAIASTVHLSEIFKQQDLGLVLSPNPQEAAQSLGEILTRPEQLQYWSVQGQKFVQDNFQPSSVATSFIRFYQEVL